jgi:hypothetical protein
MKAWDIEGRHFSCRAKAARAIARLLAQPRVCPDRF